MEELEYQIWKSEMAELMNTQRPSAERRRRDLEEAIGTFEDCMIEAMYGHN